MDTEMGSCAVSVMGRGSKGAGHGQSSLALPSDLDISSVLPFHTPVEDTFAYVFSFDQDGDVTGGRGRAKGCVALLLEA